MKQKSNRRRGKPSHVAATTSWLRQAKWLVDIMAKINEMQSAHGQKWKAGMIRHYAKSYITHRDITPKKCEQMACQHDKTIAAIIDNLD